MNSQSYLLKNADNHGIENTHVSDRIGLKLQLDDRQNYSLSLSSNGILQPVELFHYDPVADAYYTVYQAAKKGKVQLNIIPAANHTIAIIEATPVYTLTINIQ